MIHSQPEEMPKQRRSFQTQSLVGACGGILFLVELPTHQLPDEDTLGKSMDKALKTDVAIAMGQIPLGRAGIL